MQVYSDPKREHDPHALPDIEVFWDDADVVNGHASCLPDSDAIGPFGTVEDAIADVRAHYETSD